MGVWPRPRLLAIIENDSSQVTPLALPALSSVSGTHTWCAPRYSRGIRRAASWAGGTAYWRRKSEIWAKCQEQDECPLLERLPQRVAPGGDHLVPPWPSTIPAVPREAASKLHRDGRPRQGSRSLPSPMRLPALPARSVGPVSSFGACASLEARGALVFSEQVLTSLPAFRDLHPALFWGTEQCCWRGESCFPGGGDRTFLKPHLLPFPRGHRIEGWMFWPHGQVVASIYSCVSCVLTSLLSPKRRVPHMNVTSELSPILPAPRLWYYF